MRTIEVGAGRYALCLSLGLLLVSSCGMEDPDAVGEEPGGQEIEPAQQERMATSAVGAGCAGLARQGTTTGICYEGVRANDPARALVAPVSSCSPLGVGEGHSACQPVVLEKTCRPSGRTCKPSRAADCCSNACNCPLGARKCTCV